MRHGPGDAPVPDVFKTNETHAPELRSWVESANDPASDFPIQNLPFCAFDAGEEHTHSDEHGHEHSHPVGLGVAIGDRVVDLLGLYEGGFFERDDEAETIGLALEEWIGLGGIDTLHAAAPLLRRHLQNFLRHDAPGGQRVRRLREKCVLAQADVELMPVVYPPNYTDFYASIHHATTVGAMFRPENPLLPNYKHVPIGYHGRASSIIASGTEVRRPRGQTMAEGAAAPTFGPAQMLDYELEVGLVVGRSTDVGSPVPIADAARHIFGLCLVNDWSARDIQKWEYQPLGPFLAKNFATSVGCFTVTAEALAPFRVPALARPAGDPVPLDYLRNEQDEALGAFDVTLEVLIESAAMRAKGLEPARVSRGHLRDMYWTFAQLLTHHTSNGCNVQSGDLLASGTVSSAAPDARGCLLELTWQGHGEGGRPLPRRPLQLPGGEQRTFLADGDRVIMRGWCEREGFRRIGLGECAGTIVSA